MRGRINFKPPLRQKGGGKFAPFLERILREFYGFVFAKPLKF